MAESLIKKKNVKSKRQGMKNEDSCPRSMVEELEKNCLHFTSDHKELKKKKLFLHYTTS